MKSIWKVLMGVAAVTAVAPYSVAKDEETGAVKVKAVLYNATFKKDENGKNVDVKLLPALSERLKGHREECCCEECAEEEAPEGETVVNVDEEPAAEETAEETCEETAEETCEEPAEEAEEEPAPEEEPDEAEEPEEPCEAEEKTEE